MTYSQRYGLKTHHGAQFEHTPYNGVSLCCSRDEEAVCPVGIYPELELICNVGHVQG